MEKKSNKLFIITRISIILFIISVCFFIYSTLNVKNIDSMKDEHKKLSSELESINNEIIKIKKEYDFEKNNLEDLELIFISKYGYDIKEKKDKEVEKSLDILKNENKSIETQIKTDIELFSDYYSGNYYNSEEFDRTANMFLDLTSMGSVEELDVDLYSQIELDKFINIAKSEGTIGYLTNLNKNSNKNNVILFSIAFYSDSLNRLKEKGELKEKEISELNENINILYEVFKLAEDSGLSTGELSSNRLLKLKNNINEFSKKYYENIGIIQVLRSKGDKI